MGRKSKTFHDLQKKILSFLLEEEGVQNRLKVCRQLVDSMLRSRGVRKIKYKNELERTHENLCLIANDYDELKKKYEALEKKYAKSQDKNAKLSDKLVRMESDFKFNNR